MKQDRKTFLSACFMLMILGFGSYVLAAPREDQKLKGLTVQLISDHATIAAGEPFLLGFHIQHQKGYHTYWKNPGLVGLATDLEWKLPEGYKASPVNWPYPELSSMAGNPCYGYERDVTLYVTVTPPKQITSKKVSISVDAMWMCCANNCFPGNGTFTIELPVGEKAQKNVAKETLFTLAKNQTPLPYPASNTQLLSLPTDQSIRVQVSAPLPDSLDGVYLFSADGQISSADKQTIEKQADGSWIITAKRSEYSPKKTTSLPAILKIGDKYHRVDPSYTK